MSVAASPKRVLFLTPFHFADPTLNVTFDDLVTDQLGGTPGVEIVAQHVPLFDADEDTYDAEQEHAVVTAIEQATAAGFDAVAIACHYDPALAAARLVSSLPVVGPLQLTAGLAAQYGPSFHAITDVSEAEEHIGNLIRSYGLGDNCSGVTAIGLDGDSIMRDTQAAAQQVDGLVREIAARGGTNAVLIACTIVSAAYELHRAEFTDHGVPVLNSNLLTVQGAAILA